APQKLQSTGRQRHRPDHRGGGILRPPRPERRRQDHDLAHDRRPAAARRRHDRDFRRQCAERCARRQTDGRLAPRRADALRQAHRARISGVRRRAVGHGSGCRRTFRLRAFGTARPVGSAQRALRRLLARHETEGSACRRAHPRSETADPRRAAHRPRRRDRASGQGSAARPRAARLHHHPDHSYPRRGGTAGRPHRHHPGRRGAGGRHARGIAPPRRPRGFDPGRSVPQPGRRRATGRRMSTLAVSPLFLLRHELRLQWRALSKKTPLLVTLAVLIVFLHAIAAGLAYSVRFMPPVPANALVAGITCALAFLLLMSISSGIVVAMQNIYARGDMDLLLSSPLAPRTLVLVRGFAIAATLCGGACVLLLPFANMLALFVTAKWLLAYAALICVALLGTGVSLILAHGLFRLLGPRRARLFAQILGGLLAAVLPLVGQIPNAMSASTQQHAAGGLMAMLDHGPAPDSLLWLPARAFTGDPLALAVIASICCAVFAVATIGLAEVLVG